MKKFFNKILVEPKIPVAQRKSGAVPIVKGKKDTRECGNFKGI